MADGADVVLACDAILFDMDGTLVDSMAVVERVWLAWAARHGIDARTALAVCHGLPTRETIACVAPHLATDAEAASIDAAEAADLSGLQPGRGALALLATIPRERWAVVTSASPAVASARLHAVGLADAPLVVTAADVRARKPDPEPYLTAAARLGVAPGRTLVVEDTPIGAAAGRAAGARVIGVATTYADVAGCDHLVDHLGSLTVSRSEDPAAGGLRVTITGAKNKKEAP